jgi:hypothetical protein
MFDKINVPNKFSFGPSPENEGRKKTVHTIEGFALNQYQVCPIQAEPLHQKKNCVPTEK